jgi:hypothetical protein
MYPPAELYLPLQHIVIELPPIPNSLVTIDIEFHSLIKLGNLTS